MTDNKHEDTEEETISKADGVIITLGNVYRSTFRLTLDVTQSKDGLWDVMLVSSEKLVEKDAL